MKKLCKGIIAAAAGLMVFGAALPAPATGTAFAQRQEQTETAWKEYDDGAMTVRWKVEEKSAGDKEVSLVFRSKSTASFSLGWTDDPQFILTTEQGDFPTKEISPRLTNFNRKFDSSPLSLRLTFRKAHGTARKLLITKFHALNNRGLPTSIDGGVDLVLDLEK